MKNDTIKRKALDFNHTIGLAALKNENSEFGKGFRNGIEWLYCSLTDETFIGEEPAICKKK